ncbi:MAG: hypothetical protein U5K69_07335 [Balneolaceae bacterium]|nr:hypothetical protein [Balneolaceae bacterium]
MFSSHLSEDGKGIFLVIPDIQETMQMQVDYSIQSSDGTAIDDQLWFSVHDVQEPNLAAYGFPNLNIDELAMESAATSVTEQEEQPPTVERGRELFRQTGCIELPLHRWK